MSRRRTLLLIGLLVVGVLGVYFGGLLGPAMAIEVWSYRDSSYLGADTGWPLERTFSPAYTVTLAQVELLLRWTVKNDVKQSWDIAVTVSCDGKVMDVAQGTFFAYVPASGTTIAWFGLNKVASDASGIMLAGHPCSMLADIVGGTGMKSDIAWMVGSRGLEAVVWGYPALLAQPTADFSYTVGSDGLTVDFSGTASGGTPPYTYSYDFGDGTGANTQSTTHTYSVPVGQTITFHVIFRVTDANQQQDEEFRNVVLTGTAPTPEPLDVGFTWSANERLISFVGSASGGTIPYTYAWDFGDGSIAGYGASTTHSYAQNGTYKVVLQVTDGAGVRKSVSADAITGSGSGGDPCTIDPTLPECSADAIPLWVWIAGLVAAVVALLVVVRRRLF